MKPNAPLAVLALAAMAAMLTGCSNAVMDPKYERNPNPRQKYVVTAKIDGAPGPFEKAFASVRYKIGPTQECMPDAEPFSGHFPTPDDFGIEPKVSKVSGTEYRFEMYLDAMASKNYFGKGICSWVVDSINVYLKPVGASKSPEFAALMVQSDVTHQQPVVLYARREIYAKPLAHPYDSIEPALKKEPATKRYGSDQTKLFIITLQAKEVGHEN
ncbi:MULTISPECIES: hypothetical protein [Lysobacter]|jgi:hypothetical protein|uniref:hypothetical protein n=1 Tax=Lysobacter TaxID=68 RepID=UPI001F28F2D3|nr:MULTISPECIES: hypothetical protein [Lysobacter]UJB18908.1 hypothetical protein L1A79_21760 [Lysobacter capsici]UJQ27367.1 hypothetical protein L2D09_18125 [Lysobacter gummosus]